MTILQTGKLPICSTVSRVVFNSHATMMNPIKPLRALITTLELYLLENCLYLRLQTGNLPNGHASGFQLLVLT